jgi:hypothetical protein
MGILQELARLHEGKKQQQLPASRKLCAKRMPESVTTQ